MNVRLDYRHIHYWQRVLGRPDRTLGTHESPRVYPQNSSGEVRPPDAEPLQQGAPAGRPQSLRHPQR
jgi:hypothetical protein